MYWIKWIFRYQHYKKVTRDTSRDRTGHVFVTRQIQYYLVYHKSYTFFLCSSSISANRFQLLIHHNVEFCFSNGNTNFFPVNYSGRFSEIFNVTYNNNEINIWTSILLELFKLRSRNEKFGIIKILIFLAIALRLRKCHE